MPTQNADQLLLIERAAIAHAGSQAPSGCHLRVTTNGIDMGKLSEGNPFQGEKLHLSYVDFAGAKLTNANLREAELRGADFRYAETDGADISGACIRNTKFNLPKFFRMKNADKVQRIINSSNTDDPPKFYVHRNATDWVLVKGLYLHDNGPSKTPGPWDCVQPAYLRKDEISIFDLEPEQLIEWGMPHILVGKVRQHQLRATAQVPGMR